MPYLPSKHHLFVLTHTTFFPSLYCCPPWFRLTCCLLSFCLLQPVIDGYQNKSTFSVNRGPDGNPKTVGYYLGTWRDQSKAMTSRNRKPRTERQGQGSEYSVSGSEEEWAIWWPSRTRLNWKSLVPNLITRLIVDTFWWVVIIT